MARVYLPCTRAFLYSVMEDFSQQATYTIEEIRTKFATRSLPDWDSPPYGPFIGELVTWEQWREAFPPKQKTKTLEPSNESYLEERERYRQALSWTGDPFQATILPFAAYLEPAGYTALGKMASPVTKSYQRLVPRTYALALALYASLPQRSVWGHQERAKGVKAPWLTVTAGKRIDAKRKDGTKYQFPQQAMSLLDILKMLGNADFYSLANKDVPFGRPIQVRHVRTDIDLDRMFREDHYDHHPDLVDEIHLVRRIYAAFGLTAYIFRTGNRGIQAVAPIPPTDRREASLLTECVRTVLAGTRLHLSCATDFQTNLDGLMRIPLGRHGLTESLALFLGEDGFVLPPDQQVECVLASFCSIPEMDMGWAEEARPRLAQATSPDRAIKKNQLGKIVADLPDNPLIKTFLSACREFDVRNWNEVCTHTTLDILEESNVDAPDGKLDLCTHTTPSLVEAAEGDGLNVAGRKSIWKSPNKLKEIGQAILDGKFDPGASYPYYMNLNGGRNAIGWALVLHDGDLQKAEDDLIERAKKVGGLPGAVEDRIGLIKRLIPLNDTYERFQKRAEMFKHRALDGDVLDSETLLAEAFIAALAEKRRNSSQRIKAFQPKALAAIGHIIELAQLAARSSQDGLVRISTGTLAAQITQRWPECEVSKSSVVKLMEWITAGEENCLLKALEVFYKPMRVTEPTVYELGSGIWDLVPVELK